jgi:hypothetical protein
VSVQRPRRDTHTVGNGLDRRSSVPAFLE